MTFASTGGLLQALARGGDDLKGRNLAVKRREGKSNGTAPAAKKIAAVEKASYYGTSEMTGSDRSEKHQRVNSRAGSRFSSSSSSSGVAGTGMGMSHSRDKDRDRPTSLDRLERSHGDDSHHEVGRGGQGRDSDQNSKRNSDDNRGLDRHRKRNRSESPDSRPRRMNRSISRSRSRSRGDEKRGARKRSVSSDRRGSSRPRNRDNRSLHRRSRSPGRRFKSPPRRKATSERMETSRSASSDGRNESDKNEVRREGWARLRGDEYGREGKGGGDREIRSKARKGIALSDTSGDSGSDDNR